MIIKSEIEQKFKMICRYKRLSERTIECYSSFLSRFLREYKDHPINASSDYLMEYLGSMTSHSQQKQMTGALIILYRDVLKCSRKIKCLKYPKKETKVPKVISHEEVARIVQASQSNLKHRAIICVLYESGLRVSELLNLKISDIDRYRMQLFVKAAKGKKDRHTVLGIKSLKAIEKYYRAYKPKVYLFEGQNGGQYSATSVRALLRTYCEKSKVRSIHPHILRHSFATHHLENNTPQSKVQNMLGHTSFKTTQIYTHVTCDNVAGLLSQPKKPVIYR